MTQSLFSRTSQRAPWPTPGTAGSVWDWLHFAVGILLSLIASMMMLDAHAMMRYAWVAGTGHEGVTVGWVRWFTAHWVHLSLKHYAVNLLAWCFLVCIVPWLHARREFWLSVLVSSITIPLALTFMPFDVMWYVGLSGVLHAAFTAVALGIALQPQARWWERCLALGLALGAIGKSLPAMQVPIEFIPWLSMPTVPIAHLIGTVTGVWVALVWLLIDYVRARRQTRTFQAPPA